MDDPRYRLFADRLAHREELTTLIDEALSTRTTAQWMAIFGGSVPASPVLSIDQALDSAYVQDRGRIATMETASGAHVRLVRNPLTSSKADGEALGMSPAFGEHTHEVLADCGFSAEEIAALQADGTV